MRRAPEIRTRPAVPHCAGIAAVELVLVLPVLLALFALVLDGGRMLADYHAVSKSVRDAARYLARADLGPVPCAVGDLNRARPEVARAVRLAMTGRVDGDPSADALVGGWQALDLSEAATGISLRVECLDNSGAALGGLYAGAAVVPSIVVHARVPFNFGPGRILGLGPAFTLQVAHKSARTGA